ncbi:MAG: DUF4386 domain-containing protein [Candidatus Saccharimonadales bacterium]
MSFTKLPSHRKTSLIAGILYLLTFVSIPSLAYFYLPVKKAGYILGAGSDIHMIIGGILEVIVALAGIGTAVVLFSVLKKQNETAALGLVAARILESASIFAGVACLLTVVTLHKEGVGVASLPVSHAFVTLYERLFLISQSFMPAICDLLLGFLLFKSRLVPRGLAMIGIIGGPLLLVGYFAVLFGVIGQHAPLAGLSSVFVAVFEFSLGVWLIAKGFSPKAVAVLESNDK